MKKLLLVAALFAAGPAVQAAADQETQPGATTAQQAYDQQVRDAEAARRQYEAAQAQYQRDLARNQADVERGVGSTQTWTSETRPGVTGSSTVTAAAAPAEGNPCVTVTDVIIVDGEETRAPKRMCRRPPTNRYVRV